jgi:hypothetical protein
VNDPHHIVQNENTNVSGSVSMLEKKKSVIQNPADNTLTLIFDSDDEQINDNNGEPEIKEIEEEVSEDQSSLNFNDEEDSKIERNSSAGNGSSRIINNLITSNSF